MDEYYTQQVLKNEHTISNVLVHNRIKFMVEFADGLWEFTVQKGHQKSLDLIIRHLECVNNEILHKDY